MHEDNNTIEVTNEHDAVQLLKKFQEDIERCEKNSEWREALEQIKSNRKLARGKEQHVNMIHSTNQAMIPNIYAKNPEGSVIPAPKAGKQGDLYNEARNLSETLEILLNHAFDNSGLKKKAKRQVRSVQTSRMGWIKVIFQSSYGDDPMIRSRINDAQDNIARLQSISQSLNEENDMSPEDNEARSQELESLVTALENQVEVMVAYGLNIDHIDTLNVRIDPDIPSLQDYIDASWICHFEDMDGDYVKSKFSVSEERMKDLKEYKKEDDDRSDANPMYRIWERWDKDLNTVFTWIDGDKEWIKEPYSPNNLGERWYPFFGFGHHWLDGQMWPLSDVELLEKLQEEHEDTRKSQQSVRKGSKAYVIVDGTAISVNDTVKVEQAADLDIVVMDLGGAPIGQSIHPGVQPQYNPALYDTSQIRQDMEFAVNVSDAARGSVEQTKTLGEAEILNSHMAQRSNERIDELETMLSELYQYVAELLMLNLDQSMVAQVVGEGAFWPDMNKDEAFKNVLVEIRAGSTTKPDRAREQKQWTELLPQLTELIPAIMDFRARGVADDQNPLAWLLKETLKRYDERISLDEVLPPQPQQQSQVANIAQLPPELLQQLPQQQIQIMDLENETTEPTPDDSLIAEAMESIGLTDDEAVGNEEETSDIETIDADSDGEVGSIEGDDADSDGLKDVSEGAEEENHNDDSANETEGMKPATAERFEKLTKDYKSLNTEHEAVVSERDEFKKERDNFQGIIEYSGASTDEFMQLMEVSHNLKSGDKGKMEMALNALDQKRAEIAKQLGKEIPGVDLLADHPELMDQVNSFSLSRENALQIANSRNLQAQQDQFTQQHNSKIEQQRQSNDAQISAIESIKQLETHWKSSDADYLSSKQQSLTDYALYLRDSGINPSLWPQMVSQQYKILTDTIKSTASSQRPKNSNIETLRPKGAGKTVADPKNVADIAWNALQEM